MQLRVGVAMELKAGVAAREAAMQKQLAELEGAIRNFAAMSQLRDEAVALSEQRNAEALRLRAEAEELQRRLAEEVAAKEKALQEAEALRGQSSPEMLQLKDLLGSLREARAPSIPLLFVLS